MRLVLDTCVPQPLRHDFVGHTVFTTGFLGLDRLSDKPLIDALDGKFDVLITCDRSIPWQQNFAGRTLAVVVLRAPTNKLRDLQVLVLEVLRQLPGVAPGEVRTVG